MDIIIQMKMAPLNWLLIHRKPQIDAYKGETQDASYWNCQTGN